MPSQLGTLCESIFLSGFEKRSGQSGSTAQEIDSSGSVNGKSASHKLFTASRTKISRNNAAVSVARLRHARQKVNGPNAELLPFSVLVTEVVAASSALVHCSSSPTMRSTSTKTTTTATAASLFAAHKALCLRCRSCHTVDMYAPYRGIVSNNTHTASSTPTTAGDTFGRGSQVNLAAKCKLIS